MYGNNRFILLRKGGTSGKEKSTETNTGGEGVERGSLRGASLLDENSEGRKLQWKAHMVKEGQKGRKLQRKSGNTIIM